MRSTCIIYCISGLCAGRRGGCSTAPLSYNATWLPINFKQTDENHGGPSISLNQDQCAAEKVFYNKKY